MNVIDRTYSNQDLEEALKNCGREAIHQIGYIQPAGLLLAVDDNGMLISHVSENVGYWFPYTHDWLIGKPLSLLIGEQQAANIRKLPSMNEGCHNAFTEFSIDRNGMQLTLDAKISRSGNLWLLEIEQDARDPELYQKLFIPIPDSLWQPNIDSNFPPYTQAVVEQIRSMIGYDRVMMYQFNDKWDGEVIAESKSAVVESYLGNRFPASDIPPQARDLYTKNLVRLITDVDAIPVPIYPTLDPHTGQPLDMTCSALRALSPVHLEYLRNMGVRATLTISLIQNGQLWGLIACHNATPKYIPMRVREMYEFLGKTISIKLFSMGRNAQVEYLARTRLTLDSLTHQVQQQEDVHLSFEQMQNGFLSLVNADGAALKLGGRYTFTGHTPSGAQIRDIEDWLDTFEQEDVFHVDTLGMNVFSTDTEGGSTCGMLLARLDRHEQNFIAWFRKENIQTIKWAGHQDKTVTAQDGVLKMSPRKSFATWIETFRGSSIPWTQEETDAVRSLSTSLKEVLYLQALQRSEEQYRTLYGSHMDDMRAARNILDFIMRSEGLQNPKIRFFQRPAEQFSGDFIAAATDENGDLRIILADVTGHGLQAALPLLPIVRTFHSMVKKTLSTGMIVREVNQTMRDMGMPGRFMAAAVAHISRGGGLIEIWNGGIPTTFHIQQDGGLHKFRSMHLPLGILDVDAFDATTEILHATPGSLLICSDGLVEAEDASGTPFGEERIESILQTSQHDLIFDDLLSSLETHLYGKTAHDDVSIVPAKCGI